MGFVFLTVSACLSGAVPEVAKRSVSLDSAFYRYEFNTFLGIHITDETALVSGGRFALAPIRRTVFYVGPEVNYSLFSPGSLLQVLGSGYYEVHIYVAPRLRLSFGLLCGLGITLQMAKYSSLTWVTYADVGVSQEVTKLAVVRGSFRPGFVGGYYSFIMSMGLGFRFL